VALISNISIDTSVISEMMPIDSRLTIKHAYEHMLKNIPRKTVHFHDLLIR